MMDFSSAFSICGIWPSTFFRSFSPTLTSAPTHLAMCMSEILFQSATTRGPFLLLLRALIMPDKEAFSFSDQCGRGVAGEPSLYSHRALGRVSLYSKECCLESWCTSKPAVRLPFAIRNRFATAPPPLPKSQPCQLLSLSVSASGTNLMVKADRHLHGSYPSLWSQDMQS
jgi:hypothetical protein